ncbi:MAG: pyridoxamine 5'-phosphate oxidase family protein [Desulfomonilaceae bacterium]
MGLSKKELELRNQLVDLFKTQRFSVLATLEQTRPYVNLVAFAETEDLSAIFFATTRATRKYTNISAQSGVAMLVDNRSNEVADLSHAVAVTIIGTASELDEKDRALAEQKYLAKHPHMGEFLSSPTTALMKLEVETFYVVNRFQNVTVFNMKS